MLGIKSEAIHSLTEKRVPKLVYYHSSDSGVPTSSQPIQQHPNLWKSPEGPTEPWNLDACPASYPQQAEWKYLTTSLSKEEVEYQVISVSLFAKKERTNRQRGKSPRLSLRGRGKSL